MILHCLRLLFSGVWHGIAFYCFGGFLLDMRISSVWILDASAGFVHMPLISLSLSIQFDHIT